MVPKVAKVDTDDTAQGWEVMRKAPELTLPEVVAPVQVVQEQVTGEERETENQLLGVAGVLSTTTRGWKRRRKKMTI